MGVGVNLFDITWEMDTSYLVSMPHNIMFVEKAQFQYKLELVYLPKGKYCVYPRMVYRQAMA